MTAPHADQLIDGYLARLRAAAADLPSSAREELLSDVRSHIAEARARESDETDATILNMLDRLGEPALVVAEARDRPGIRPQQAHRAGLVEIAAVVLLPLIWVAGVILLWWSTAWNVRDKIIGTIGSLGGYPFVLILGTFTAHVASGSGIGSSCGAGVDSAGNVIPTTCTGPSALDILAFALHIGVFLALVLLPVLTSIYLVIRLRLRPMAGPTEQPLAV